MKRANKKQSFKVSTMSASKSSLHCQGLFDFDFVIKYIMQGLLVSSCKFRLDNAEVTLSVPQDEEHR